MLFADDNDGRRSKTQLFLNQQGERERECEKAPLFFLRKLLGQFQ